MNTARRRPARLGPRTAAVALGVAGSLILAACSGSSGGSGDQGAGGDVAAGDITPGGTLNVGITGEPGNLDPTYAATLTSISVYNAMCEQLYNTTHDGQVVPQLAAADPEFNEDGTVATIKLREGVTFADGTPFDAEAVKFSIERHKTAEGSQRTNELDAVETVEVVDEHTVEVQMSGPISPGAFSVIFSDRSGIMVSPTAVEEKGEAFAEAPVCVGPFKFDGRIPQDSVTVVKDENYYAADDVHLDKIVFRVIPDSNVRATNLLAGELQVAERVATTDVANIQTSDDVDLLIEEGLGYLNLEFNVANAGGEHGTVDTPIAQDARIRRAFAMSIDRDAINQVVYNGLFSPACGFMAPSSKLATDVSTSCPDYDPEAARKLLESTGVELPLRVEVMLNQQPELRRIAEAIQQMVNEVGFDLVLDIAESTATVERGYAGDFEIYMNSWSGRVDPDANISLFAKSDSPRSMSRYANPRVDELIESARASGDEAERAAKYDELHTILQEDAPLVFLIRPNNIVGVSKDVVGLDMRANGTAVAAFAGFVGD